MAQLKFDLIVDDKGRAKVTNFSGTVNKEMLRAETGVKRFSHSLGALKSMFLGVAAAAAAWKIAGLGRDIVVMGAQFEQSMATVRGVMRADEQQFQALEAIAKKMGETTEWTASQSAEALKFLGMAGFQAEKAIAALPGTLDLATAGGIELGAAADIATNALTAMQLPVEQLTRINDVFIATITRTNTNMEMMAESFKYAAPIANAFGYSVESLSAMIGGLGNAGIQGSMAGTQLAFAMQKVGDVWKKLGMDGEGKSFLDSLEAINKAGWKQSEVMEAFGMRGGRAALVLRGMIPQIRALETELQNSGGEAKRLADVMRATLSGAFKELRSAVESVGLDVYAQFQDELTQSTKDLAQAVRDNKGEVIEFVAAMKSLGSSAIKVVKLFGDLKSLIERMPGPRFLLAYRDAIIDGVVYGLGLLVGNDALPTLVDQARTAAQQILFLGDAIKRLNEADPEGNREAIQKRIRFAEQKLADARARLAGITGAKAYDYEMQMPSQTAMFTPTKPSAQEGQAPWDALSLNRDVFEPPSEDVGIKKLLADTEEMRAKIPEILKSLSTDTQRLALSDTDFRRVQLDQQLADLEKYAASDASVRAAMNEYRKAATTQIVQDEWAKEHAVANSLRESWGLTWEEVKTGGVNAMTEVSDAMVAMSQAAAATFADVITGEQSLAEGAKSLLRMVVQESIAGLIKIGVQRMLLAVMEKTATAAQTAATVAQAGVVTAATTAEMAAITAAAIPAAATVSIATAGAAPAFGATALIAALGAMTAAMAAIAIFDQGGVNTKPGLFRSNVPEAHVPLKSGNIPVQINGGSNGPSGGNTIIIHMDRPVFQDLATQRQVFAALAAQVAAQVAPGAIVQNYQNNGAIRRMVRGGR